MNPRVENKVVDFQITLCYPFFISNHRTKKRISPQEFKLLCELLTKQYVSRITAAETLWPNADTMPDTWENTLGVHRFHLRLALKPFGWKIKFHRKIGYELQKIT